MAKVKAQNTPGKNVGGVQSNEKGGTVIAYKGASGPSQTQYPNGAKKGKKG